MYHSLVKKGPWAVHITLCSDRGWADICSIAAFYHEKAPMLYIITTHPPSTSLIGLVTNGGAAVAFFGMLFGETKDLP